jgi:hypothetical protein
MNNIIKIHVPKFLGSDNPDNWEIGVAVRKLKGEHVYVTCDYQDYNKTYILGQIWKVPTEVYLKGRYDMQKGTELRLMKVSELNAYDTGKRLDKMKKRLTKEQKRKINEMVTIEVDKELRIGRYDMEGYQQLIKRFKKEITNNYKENI